MGGNGMLAGNGTHNGSKIYGMPCSSIVSFSSTWKQCRLYLSMNSCGWKPFSFCQQTWKKVGSRGTLALRNLFSILFFLFLRNFQFFVVAYIMRNVKFSIAFTHFWGTFEKTKFRIRRTLSIFPGLIVYLSPYILLGFDLSDNIWLMFFFRQP